MLFMILTKTLNNKTFFWYSQTVWNKIITLTLKLNMNMNEENLNVQDLHTDVHDTAQCV